MDGVADYRESINGYIEAWNKDDLADRAGLLRGSLVEACEVLVSILHAPVVAPRGWQLSLARPTIYSG